MSSIRALSRLSSRVPSSAFKLNTKPIAPATSPFKPTSQSPLPASAKRSSQISRLPVELSCMVSMMPLHSAIASARLQSNLSVESQSWGLVPQGKSMPL